MDPWDLSPPKVVLRPRHKAEGSPNTDVSEGVDEINFEDDEEKDKDKKLKDRVKDLEDRMNGASAVCNPDGTITITF